MKDDIRALASIMADKLRIERKRGEITPEHPATIISLLNSYNAKFNVAVTLEEVEAALAVLEYKRLVMRVESGVYWLNLDELPEVQMLCRLLGGEMV